MGIIYRQKTDKHNIILIESEKQDKSSATYARVHNRFDLYNVPQYWVGDDLGLALKRIIICLFLFLVWTIYKKITVEEKEYKPRTELRR